MKSDNYEKIEVTKKTVLNNTRKIKGITLISLVITIIILLILAGISIVALEGENGLFTRAKQAKNNTLDAQKAENEALQGYKDKINETIEGTGKTELKLASQVKAINYGDKINYSANGIEDWKIFYNDGTNVFIITSDYLPIGKIPTNIGMTTTGTYQAYWSSSSSFVDTTIDETTANKYMLKRTGFSTINFTTSNENYKATASLMNTSKWSAFVNANKADSAIGGPTLEMYVASWNAKGHTPLYCNNGTSTGYYLGDIPGPTTNSYNMTTEECLDTLYSPHSKDSYLDCYGYYLASPSSSRISSMVGVGLGTMGNPDYNNTHFAIRPVVCLNSGVTATYNEATKTWSI